MISNINDFVALAQRIHDAEGMDFGSRSTRESRNAQWARIVGIAHHGHPVYNPTPDPRWHLKNGGGGRPQSDDVVVLMPSRAYWDCIPNAGLDVYTFRPGGHPGPLPMEQEVFPPPVPDGGGGVQPKPEPQPQPQPKPAPDYTEQIARVASALLALSKQIASLESRVAGIDERLDEDWAARVWTATDPDAPAPEVKVPPFPTYEGRILGQRFTLEPRK